MARYFISYNHLDKKWAEWIAWQLQQAGHQTIIQAWDFRPGSNFVLEMDHAVKESDFTVAVLSPSYLASPFAKAEWAAAFVQDPTGEQRRLIPVRVREFERSGLLTTVTYIDLVDLNEESARAELLSGVEPGRGSPSVPPDFPGIRGETNAERPKFPGSLPSIWQVPHPRNPHFVGRSALLAALESKLETGDEGTPTLAICAVSGLGGVGKTQVAVEYAFRHAGEYDLAIWLSAEDPAVLTTGYAALARELGLPDAEPDDQSAVIEVVRRWLEQSNQRCLVVFDNAVNPATIEPYLPRAGQSHVLITSQSPIWPGYVETLPVSVLSASEAVQFLLQRTQQTDEVTAGELAEELGFLPLALEQAAAYVNARGISLQGYLERFRARRSDLLQRGEPTNYSATVATTWDLAFQGASEQADCAADLLRLCAFFAPDAIPLDLVTLHPDVLPESMRACTSDAIRLDDAVLALRRYSLIDVVDDRSVSVHRLVQGVVRDRMSREQQQSWCLVAMMAQVSVFPDESHDPRSWPIWERVLPHALAAVHHAAALELTDKLVSKIDVSAGIFLSSRGRPVEARLLIERGLKLGEAILSPDDPEIAVALHHLARAKKELADLSGALKAVERALQIDEAIFGSTSLQVADDLDLAGNILRQQGKYSGARAQLERALTIRQAELAPDASQVATSLNNLGNVLRDQGEYRKAGDLHAEALRIHEATFEPGHPEIGIDCGNLGQDLIRLGEFDAARAQLERALAIHEAAYGADHPMVAIALGNLARAQQASGYPIKSKELLERALSIDQAVYGPDHPHVAADLDNLANTLQDLGELEEAGDIYRRVLEIREGQYGREHPEVATVINNLGVLLLRQGELEEAKERLERALAIGEAAYGPEHPAVATYLFNLANVLQHIGDLAGALPLLERAAQIRKATISKEHPEFVVTISGLASVLLRLGSEANDRPMLQRALGLWRSVNDQSNAQATLRVIREIDDQTK